MSKENIFVQFDDNTPEGGKELIGYIIEHFIDGKFSRFLAKGKIVDYYKVKSKGSGSNVIIGGKYLIEYSGGKKYWRRRCEFKVVSKTI